MTNPWNLPKKQAEAVSLLVNNASGCNKKVAQEMGIAERTVEEHLRRAYKRMGATNRIQAALIWDRWERAL